MSHQAVGFQARFAQSKRQGSTYGATCSPIVPNAKGWRVQQNLQVGSQLGLLLLVNRPSCHRLPAPPWSWFQGSTRTGSFRAPMALQAADTPARGHGRTTRSPATTIKAAPCWRATDQAGKWQSAAPALRRARCQQIATRGNRAAKAVQSACGEAEAWNRPKVRG